MLIAADIGNTSITIGYFSGRDIIVQRIPAYPLLSADEYRQLIHAFIRETNTEIFPYSGIISSVVPGHTGVLKEAIERLSKDGKTDVIVLGHEMAGIGFRINNPEELGTDRIANAVAAFSLYHQPVAVIDFGTATTITVVDGNGDYIGGSIMPGLGLMNRSLGSRTSKLREIELREPSSALGKDTEGCMLSGLLIGTAGAVERIIEEVEAETLLRFNTILTGGHSVLMDKVIRRPHILKSDLTLEGLRILHEKNRP